MPLYEYECVECGGIEEALQKFSDKPLTKCKHCSGMLHKLVSQSSFHLKGSGWYVTDYANKSQHNASVKSGDKKMSSKSEKAAKPEKAAKAKQSSDKIS